MFQRRSCKHADVLLVLDDSAAIPCHSHILAMHSAVISNMLADLASQPNENIKIPLPDLTADQCLALLEYLNSTGTSYKGPAFEEHKEADLRAALAVARFAHTYDVPHALRHIEAYQTAFMNAQYKTKTSGGMCKRENSELLGCYNGYLILNDKSLVEWALMAEHFGMHELHNQCEGAMVMHWEWFQDRPNLVDQLSSAALQRIAKGLNKAKQSPFRFNKLPRSKYPSVRDFAAWRKEKQPTA